MLEARDATSFHLVVMFQRLDGLRLVELGFADPRAADADPVTRTRAGAQRFLDEGIRISAGGRPCSATLEDVGPAQSDAYGVSALVKCASTTAALRVEMPFIERLSASHQHLSSVIRGDQRSDHVLERGATSIDLDPVGPSGRADARSQSPVVAWLVAVARMLSTGIWHILKGWDHLLFVLALMLATPHAARLVGVLTAFTLAHSITLVLTGLGVLSLSPRIVEPAIAASIAVVALQTAAGRQVQHGWAVAFAFGLIHGAGFGRTLGDLAVAKDRLIPALVGFNLGVELGQLAVVLVAWPLLALFRNQPRAVRGVSLSIGVVGLALMIWRIAAR